MPVLDRTNNGMIRERSFVENASINFIRKGQKSQLGQHQTAQFYISPHSESCPCFFLQKNHPLR